MQLYEGTNRTGMIQLLEDWTGTDSSSNYTRQAKTRDLNLGMDAYMALSIPPSGSWQADDFNHTRYPNMSFDLIANQQDYNFNEDEQGNKVRDIYRVECRNKAGEWTLLTPYNEMKETDSLGHQETFTGTPYRYYKTANGVFLDVTPDYSFRMAQEGKYGIRMWYARTPKYFTVASGTTDDTTQPGIPSDHHIYPILWASYHYWLILDTAKANQYLSRLTVSEKIIKSYYANRQRDVENILTSECVNPI